MEEQRRLELISLAITRLIDEENNKNSSDPSSVGDGDGDGDESEDRALLRNLLSQIESLKQETEQEEIVKNPDECSREEIVEEIKKVKRQNLVTHCLLSVMILVTVVWQLSEVSIVLNVKHKISHPIRSLGSFLSGLLKLRTPKFAIVEAKTKKNSSKQDHDETCSVLPHVQLQLPLPS